MARKLGGSRPCFALRTNREFASISAARTGVGSTYPSLTTTRLERDMATRPVEASAAILNIARINPHCCCYCGSPFDVTRDHVIPTSYLRVKRRSEGDWLVPACRECNSTLGSELIFNVPDRAAWVAAAYRQKYAKIVRMVEWGEDEIEQLGPNLRQVVLGSMRARAEIGERLRHLEIVASMAVNYLARLRPHIDPEDEDIPEFMADDLHLARQRRRELIALARKRKSISEMNQ